MSSPAAAEEAPVRSERPRLNLKPRDEGAAAKLANERAAAAKSVSFFVFFCHCFGRWKMPMNAFFRAAGAMAETS